MIDKELREFAQSNRYNQKRRKYANKHFFQDHTIHASINSNEDIERMARGVETLLEMHKRNFDLVNDDIEDIERAIGKYEISVAKIISTYSDGYQSNFYYSKEELAHLINNIESYYERIAKLNMRKMMQD